MRLRLILLMLCTAQLFGCTSPEGEKQLQSGETIPSAVARITRGATTDEEKIRKIYYFVRDEIQFGWVYPQNIPAEQVLQNRKGVCMQKSNLLVAMAREAGLRARFHFMYVSKKALEDFLPAFAYKRWVDPFAHTFPEIYLNGKWVSMEATFDKELHEICLKTGLNFARNDAVARNVAIEFSADGVKGHQQYVHTADSKSFYGEDLSTFDQYFHAKVPWWKRLLQPYIFKKADSIMTELRQRHGEQAAMRES